jgi:precorrin-8X/cobalt-precorrin-8 methylmutase
MSGQPSDVMEEIRKALSKEKRVHVRRLDFGEDGGSSPETGAGAEGGSGAEPVAGDRTIEQARVAPAPAPGAPGLFDLLVMVDWSAKDGTTWGRDSTWLAVGDGTLRAPILTCNTVTRSGLDDAVRKALDVALEHDLRVLLGYDFAFGYPEGFANVVKKYLTGGSGAGGTWRDVWCWLEASVIDRTSNVTNRFNVADTFNRSLKTAFFWGRPPSLTGLPALPSQKPTASSCPAGMGLNPLGDRRATELAMAKSVWQLFGAGSVGSQTLTGVPYLERLHSHCNRFQQTLVVWPQETGFRPDPLARFCDARFLLVEIWPSLLVPAKHLGSKMVADEWQVAWMVELCRAQQAAGGLPLWFDPPRLKVMPRARAAAMNEEGWILGV